MVSLSLGSTSFLQFQILCLLSLSSRVFLYVYVLSDSVVVKGQPFLLHSHFLLKEILSICSIDLKLFIWHTYYYIQYNLQCPFPGYFSKAYDSEFLFFTMWLRIPNLCLNTRYFVKWYNENQTSKFQKVNENKQVSCFSSTKDFRKIFFISCNHFYLQCQKSYLNLFIFA